MALDGSKRCLRRPWNKNKSPLLKYSSLPELQLVVKEGHLCQCGPTNSFTSPLCLWCTWTCKEAKHEFKSSIPRARRASAPPLVFIEIDLSTSSGKFTLLVDYANMDSNRSATPSNRTETNTLVDSQPIVPSISPHMPVHKILADASAMSDRCIDPHRDHTFDINTNVVNDLTQQRDLHPVPTIPEGFGNVAIAINSFSTSPPSFAQTRTSTVERSEYNPEEDNSARAETGSLTYTADASWSSPVISERISSAPLRLENVERSHSDPTNSMKPNMALKVSRRAYNVGCAQKMPGFHLDDDTHEHAQNVPLNHDEMPPIKSAHSPKHQHSRPLRRKNHLHIMPYQPPSEVSEPIAISLTLHHSPPSTSSHLEKKSSQILMDYIPPHPHTRAHSHPASSSSADPVTPPMTPTHQQSPPSSVPPKLKSADTTWSSNPGSSPVRVGHPSRPYYNAIRKNGISPPPSRARPQSQPPPSSFHLAFDLAPGEATVPTTSASRHSSMSAAMLGSPSAFSALSLSDDGDDNGDFEVHSGPTNSARLSLSSSLHRLSYDSQTHAHHARSLSRANGITSSGVGFSLSGETELRMALATSSLSGVTTLGRTTENGFQFRKTVLSTENISNNVDSTADYLHARNARSNDSFMGRVKKLRKGLKEMLMNKNATAADDSQQPLRYK